MINWKDANLYHPKNGEIIWILCCHWKQTKPGSYQLIKSHAKVAGGKVESDECGKNWRVDTWDDDGLGSHCYYPPKSALTDEYHNYIDDVFSHWCYVDEINVPKEE